MSEQTFYYTSVCVDFRIAEDVRHTGPVVHQFKNEISGQGLVSEGFNPNIHGFNAWLCKCNVGQGCTSAIKQHGLMWHYYPNVEKHKDTKSEHIYVYG